MGERLANVAGHLQGRKNEKEHRLIIDPFEFLKIESVSTDKATRLRAHYRKVLEGCADSIPHMVEHAHFDKSLFGVFKKMGPTGLSVKGFGCQGLTSKESMLALMEVGRVDGSLATFFLVHAALAMKSIEVAGTQAQKEYWLPQMAACDKIGAFGLTEPDYGSNATGLETTARRTTGGWILNGSKRWIGLAGMADVVVIWARVDDDIRGFLVETPSKGYTTSKIENKLSLRIVQNANIQLQDVFVPESHTLSGASKFSEGTQRVLETSRALVAGAATGVLIGAYERALKYALNRKQFGKSIASFQLVQERLMRTLGIVQSCVLQSLHVANMMDEGTATIAQMALTKATVTRQAREGVALCREVVGGNGIVSDFGVMIPFVDMESYYTYEGTYDINVLVAGRIVTGKNAVT
eukprot:Selendium_serpulae@DN2989_c0_g1_i2.p1